MDLTLGECCEIVLLKSDWRLSNMFFGWWKKKKEPLNCKSVLILTNLREDEVAYLSQHPDDRNITS